MGDFKPRQQLLQTLPEAIIRGIENHRLVDKLTDQFQPVKELRPLFSSQRRRYAGIVTDIAFDYFLIKHWSLFEDTPFDEFVLGCYAGLNSSISWMPPRMAHVVSKMDEHDWLSSYRSMDGISATIHQVSKRMRFTNKLSGAEEEIEANYGQIEATFLDLFGHLQEQVEKAAIEA